MASTSGIDFARLTLLDALDLAILIEEEARDRYEEFADQMDLHHTPEAARFFRFMSGNEERHRLELAERRLILFKDAPRSVTRNNLFDVEAPDYDEARAFMTARDALRSALRSEEKAFEFFVAALPRVADPLVRDLFEDLRDEEVEHRRLVEEQLERQSPDPPLAAEHFVDDPVAQ